MNGTEREIMNEIIVQIIEQGFTLSDTVTTMGEISHSAHKCHICFSSSGNT